MISLVGAFFLFHLGSVPPPMARLSFRAEAHRAAVELTRGELLVGRVGVESARGTDLQVYYEEGPVTENGPVHANYRSKEWVASVTHQLDVADHPLVRAAVWLSGMPLDLEARESRFCVRLTLKGF